MKGYGQFCPIAKASEVLGERWTHLVIRELGAGSDTFNALRKGLPRMSPTLLSNRLKSLERNGLVERQMDGNQVRYLLTDAGRELKPVMLQLGAWGQRWVRSNLDREDLDPSLLVWDIHRTLDKDFFGNDRTVIQFEFTDYTSAFRYWWLVIQAGEVDVCLKDPGYEVNLIISTDLKTMTGVWMGHTSLNTALKTNSIRLLGDSALKKNLGAWLRRNYFAGIKPAQKVPARQ